MNKNRIITFALTAILLASPAFAQKGKRRDITAKIGAELNLTNEQRDRLRPAMEERRQQLQTLKNDSSLTDAQRKDKGREVNKTYRAKLMDILTPEQKSKLKTDRKEAAAKRKPNRSSV